MQGEDKRIPDKREAKEKPLAPSQLGQGEERNEAVARAAERGGSPSPKEAPREVAAGSEKIGGEEQTVVIQDGAGSIRIRKTAPGRGPGSSGGEARKGGSANAPRAEGGRAGDGTNLKLSWSQFEATFGEKELKEQRDAYLEQHRTKSRGGQREEDWRKFRAAVENFVDRVKPGNQTALNAAASPFAAYLAEMHRSIHREFAMRFLPSLPLVGGAFSDPNLVTRLEIIVNNDGSLHQVGVVRTSGFTPFDYGAWNAVTRAAPFPQPPKRILSGDGRVYLRWDFYNNERQCGTFNAEPFILPNPGGDPKTPSGPYHDRGTIPPDGKLGQRVTPPPSAASASRL
ncbi:MAG: TonB family protein [Polyangiales bacterium]